MYLRFLHNVDLLKNQTFSNYYSYSPRYLYSRRKSSL